MVIRGSFNQTKPFIRHKIIVIEDLQLNRWLVVQSRMSSEEIEESGIKNHIGIGLLKGTETVFGIVVFLESPVKTFLHLFKWPVGFGSFIVVLDTDDLMEIKRNAIHFEEKLGGIVDWIAVGNEGKVIRKRGEFADHIVHGQDGILSVAGGEDVIGSNDLFKWIGEEENVIVFPVDVNVGFIPCLDRRKVIGIEIDHILNQGGNCLCIVMDSLVGDPDTVDITHDVDGLTGRESIVDMVSKNKAKSVLIVMDLR